MSTSDARRRPAGRPLEPVAPALLATTVRLVWAQGVRATGVKQIAQEAVTTPQAIYTNFGSKEKLVSAAVERWATEWRAELDHELAKVPAVDRLLAVFDVLERWLAENQFRGSMVINTGLELTNSDDLAFKVIAAHRTAMVTMLAVYAVEAGLDRPAEIAKTWLVLMDGAITAAVQEASAEPVQITRQVAARILGR